MILKVTSVFNRVVNRTVRFDVKNTDFEVELVAGDSAPKIYFTCVGSDGLPINLSGANVFFAFKQPGDIAAVNADKSCDVTAPLSGVAVYSLKPADILRPGTYFGDVYIASGPIVETAPDAIRFVVRGSNK